MKINWITIRVNDFEKSKDFYGKYLGMELENEFSPSPDMTIAFFKADNDLKIELISQNGVTASNTNVSIGISSCEYAKLLEEARNNNIILSQPAILGGHTECFFVSDPNGVSIQIIKN